MASPTPTSNADQILVQTGVWGYVPLPEDHPGVQHAWEVLLQVSTIPWDALADIALLAGHAADDLVIVGGAANPILIDVHTALVAQAINHMRT